MKKTLGVLAALGFASVACQAQLLLREEFNYSDGAIQTVSGGLWSIHSPVPPAIPLVITNGWAFIDQNDLATGRDDANRIWGTGFDPTVDHTTKLYASFSVWFATLPVGQGTATGGSYFAHFKSTAANEFYTRIGANTEGAAPGTFRLAIANEAWGNNVTAKYPQDLHMGIAYRVIVRLDLATDRSTLWVDPVSEASQSVTATDFMSVTVGRISEFALRQGVTGASPNIGSCGELYLDHLRVGLSFADVAAVPEPRPLHYAAMGGLLLLIAQTRPCRTALRK